MLFRELVLRWLQHPKRLLFQLEGVNHFVVGMMATWKHCPTYSRTKPFSHVFYNVLKSSFISTEPHPD
jgi:hypothetical protein